MRLKYAILAEGLAQDASGSFSVIRIDSTVIVTADLPVRTKRAVLVALHDDDGEVENGSQLSLGIKVYSPSDEELSEQSETFRLGSRPFEDLPGVITVPMESVLELSEYGRHRIEVSARLDDRESVDAELDLFVYDSRSSHADGEVETGATA